MVVWSIAIFHRESLAGFFLLHIPCAQSEGESLGESVGWSGDSKGDSEECEPLDMPEFWLVFRGGDCPMLG
jgi:hypothetical protein